MPKVAALVAVLVGVFAVGIYLWQNELTAYLFKEDPSVVFKSETDRHSHMSNDNHEDTDITEKRKNDKAKKTEDSEKVTQSREEQTLKNSEIDGSKEDVKETKKESNNINKGK